MATPTTISNCFIEILTNLEGTLSTGFTNNPTKNSVGNRLLFTSMPEALQSSKSANLEQTHILGRSEPIKTYGGSGARVWNLELQFFAVDNAYTDVRDKIYWCESLAYPVYRNGISQGLPKLLLVMGNYLNVQVLCSNVTTSIQGPWSILGRNTSVQFQESVESSDTTDAFKADVPMYAIVTLDLEQIAPIPFGARDVQTGLHNRN